MMLSARLARRRYAPEAAAPLTRALRLALAPRRAQGAFALLARAVRNEETWLAFERVRDATGAYVLAAPYAMRRPRQGQRCAAGARACRFCQLVMSEHAPQCVLFRVRTQAAAEEGLSVRDVTDAFLPARVQFCCLGSDNLARERIRLHELRLDVPVP